MKRTSTTLLAGAVGTLGLLAGCSTDATLTASVDTLVELEARWQCDVTRFSFETAEQIESKRDQVRARFDVGADDHTLFVSMIEDDDDLRARVAARLDELCPVPAG